MRMRLVVAFGREGLVNPALGAVGWGQECRVPARSCVCSLVNRLKRRSSLVWTNTLQLCNTSVPRAASEGLCNPLPGLWPLAHAASKLELSQTRACPPQFGHAPWALADPQNSSAGCARLCPPRPAFIPASTERWSFQRTWVWTKGPLALPQEPVVCSVPAQSCPQVLGRPAGGGDLGAETLIRGYWAPRSHARAMTSLHEV